MQFQKNPKISKIWSPPTFLKLQPNSWSKGSRPHPMPGKCPVDDCQLRTPSRPPLGTASLVATSRSSPTAGPGPLHTCVGKWGVHRHQLKSKRTVIPTSAPSQGARPNPFQTRCLGVEAPTRKTREQAVSRLPGRLFVASRFAERWSEQPRTDTTCDNCSLDFMLHRWWALGEGRHRPTFLVGV